MDLCYEGDSEDGVLDAVQVLVDAAQRDSRARDAIVELAEAVTNKSPIRENTICVVGTWCWEDSETIMVTDRTKVAANFVRKYKFTTFNSRKSIHCETWRRLPDGNYKRTEVRFRNDYTPGIFIATWESDGTITKTTEPRELDVTKEY